jgi:hypothetical protein
MSRFFLRYLHDTDNARRFGSIRYPRTGCPTRERAEVVRQAMPRPDDFEVCEESDE